MRKTRSQIQNLRPTSKFAPNFKICVRIIEKYQIMCPIPINNKKKCESKHLLSLKILTLRDCRSTSSMLDFDILFWNQPIEMELVIHISNGSIFGLVCLLKLIIHVNSFSINYIYIVLCMYIVQCSSSVHSTLNKSDNESEFSSAEYVPVSVQFIVSRVRSSFSSVSVQFKRVLGFFSEFLGLEKYRENS